MSDDTPDPDKPILYAYEFATPWPVLNGVVPEARPDSGGRYERSAVTTGPDGLVIAEASVPWTWVESPPAGGGQDMPMRIHPLPVGPDDEWVRYMREVELRAHLAERDRDVKFTDLAEP
jgi:hypothetical protein